MGPGQSDIGETRQIGRLDLCEVALEGVALGQLLLNENQIIMEQMGPLFINLFYLPVLISCRDWTFPCLAKRANWKK